ncbi:PREDICTED: NAC transcription factor 29-like [Erythranthe guttata]|uniref:NAC transcription factor 29-like n=1 Tax=Erythranthe guttata TaxID=4155 RepID=UPI00064DC7C9|nr:PREDICTED: NAC transcription factor 29-like [Erythranthe guttata]|eukprot:XP_012829798.1 PREDICTED: NAC transcription factor 29-like [Erythranthe guttata]
MESYSPGYRFVPTDEELIVEYLLRKIDNQPLPADVIKVVNFSDHGPDTLTPTFYDYFHLNCIEANIHQLDTWEWYFFTPRIRKYANGSRPNRTAGNRFWKASCADKAINFNNKIIGHKMTLVFHEGRSSKDGINTDWIMHEYTAIHPSRNKRDANDNMKNVLKSSSSNKRRANVQENQEEEEQEQVAVRENRGEEEVVASHCNINHAGVQLVVEDQNQEEEVCVANKDQFYRIINNIKAEMEMDQPDNSELLMSAGEKESFLKIYQKYRTLVGDREINRAGCMQLVQDQNPEKERGFRKVASK